MYCLILVKCRNIFSVALGFYIFLCFPITSCFTAVQYAGLAPAKYFNLVLCSLTPFQFLFFSGMESVAYFRSER